MIRPQLELGGVSAHIKLLAGGLIEQSHLVQVAAGGGDQASALSAANIPVLKFPFYPSTPRNLVRSVVRLRRLVLHQQIDILHSHHRFTTIIGRLVRALTRVPLIATVHEFKTDGKPSAQLWAKNPTIVPSQALKDHLVAFYGARRDAIMVIPHALAPSPDAHRTSPYVRTFHLSAPGISVGYIGRLSPEKGARFFLASIPLIQRVIPTARFMLVGAGPEAPQLRALAAELGLDKAGLFLGSRDDVDALLEQLDILVIPSLAESFSLVALEAMRAGCPVVATSAGGLPEVVHNGATGVLVPPGDPAALAEAVAALACDPERRRRFSARARQIFEAHYSPDAMIARTLEAYQAARRG